MATTQFKYDGAELDTASTGTCIITSLMKTLPNKFTTVYKKHPNRRKALRYKLRQKRIILKTISNEIKTLDIFIKTPYSYIKRR